MIIAMYVIVQTIVYNIAEYKKDSPVFRCHFVHFRMSNVHRSALELEYNLMHFVTLDVSGHLKGKRG